MFLVRIAKPWLAPGLLLCLSSAPLQAAPALAEMVNAAIERNPGLELAGAERKLAGALRRKADQPLADAPSANLKYQTDALGSDRGYREWEGGVELPLWLPGQADGYAREAGRSLTAAESLAQAQRLEIAGEVRERLWTAAIARSTGEQARAAVGVAEKLLHDVQRRVAAGELPRSDRLLAEKKLLNRQEGLQQATNRAEQAERLFTRYTGLAASPAPATESPRAPAELSDDHPRLRLTRDRLERAKAHRDRIAVTRRSGPSVWLGAKSTRDATGAGYDSAVGVEVSLPFGTAAHTAPALAEAEAQLTQAQVEHRRTRLALEDALTRADLELARTTTSLQQTERRLALAEESLKLSRRAFELGETDLVRLLQAQDDALAARHDHQIRRLEHGRALARLNQALGVIPQ